MMKAALAERSMATEVAAGRGRYSGQETMIFVGIEGAGGELIEESKQAGR